MSSNFRIGATLLGIQSFDTVGLPEPSKQAPVNYGEFKDLGNSLERGVGGLQTEMRFQYLSQAEYTVLAGYAGLCYVRLLKSGTAASGTFAVYYGALKLSHVADPKADILLDYTVRFTHLVEQV